MKKLLFIFLTVSIFNSVSAQNPKVRVGLFKRWYIGAFEEVIGHYSIAIDTITYDYESYDEEEADFWIEQYDYHYYGSKDSLRIIIKRESILYDNEVFNNVYTIKAKPEDHYYYMAAYNNRNRTLSIIMFPDESSGWHIYISDSEKQGWQGVWIKSEISDSERQIVTSSQIHFPFYLWQPPTADRR